MSDLFDIAVVGAGPGGYVAALKAAEMGARVALVEKDQVGGTCLNRGCIPTKAFLAVAELLHDMRHRAPSMGISVGEVNFDWAAILARKEGILETQRKGLQFLFKKREIELLHGEAAFEGPGRLVVRNAKGKARQLAARDVILAAGSRPTRIPGWPECEQVVTSDEALSWTELPKRILIVGGGVIGCEFACMLAEFGVRVMLVEMLPRLINLMDAELGAELLKVFQKRGIACYLNTKVDDLKIDGSTVVTTLSDGSRVETDKVLVATGRRANSEALGLEAAGIASDRGFVPVDNRMRTGVANHWAIGDLTGRIQLAHAASAMALVAVENILGKGREFTAPVPGAVYTYPEIGAVGQTEEEAFAAGRPIAVGMFPFSASGKAQAYGDAGGFVKVVRERGSNAILGVHALGHGATEFIAAAGVLLHTRATAHDVTEMIFAHPTMSEGVREAAEVSLFEGLHLPPARRIRLKV